LRKSLDIAGLATGGAYNLWVSTQLFWSRARMVPKVLLRRFARRLVVGLAVIAYLAATVGFPLPASSGKDRSIPYPCMDHACGCQSAIQCWTSCCCFTAEERFAWARNRGIEPPDFAERPAPSCDRETHCACKEDHEHHEDSAPARSHWVIGLAAMTCNGLSASWIASGAVTAPPPPVHWTPQLPLVGELFLTDPGFPNLRFSPPVPPPR
jgi:hypothetical protein